MPARPRLVSLDAFRGLTIAGMILVNYAGSFAGMYRPLTHAPWHGFTPTDLVFPSFLFIVGVAMWFSFKPYQQRLTTSLALKVLRRTVLIYLIGLGLNALPLLFGGSGALRFLGVLPRIALCYGAASLLCLTLSPLALLVASALLLLGYWLLLVTFGLPPDPLSLQTNAVLRLDFALLGVEHLYKGYAIPFEPEGLLSTLPALVNTIAGYLTGRMIDSTSDKRRVVRTLLLWGLPLILLGRLWNDWLPINKPIWTSSYVVFTVGLALVLLGCAMWVIDVKQKPGWVQPLVVYGMNPLFVYVLASIWEGSLFRISSGGQPLMFRLQALVAPLLGAVNGGLAVALAHVLLFWAVAWVLYRRRIVIKV
jgi:predicted acyltransferase